ncbi:general L-amino acid transport system permease protein [Agrobacterium tumefaciens]|uniref:amino acid ABC transporter permease n=1 Tax=Agrobacterium tumefaciens TaxID=358 RepID=UPI000B401BC2|nr:ABC transporter permease subunit [Agrobacterium tumefaciens]MBP2511211.1 general L-amino acid transport system permease protein [Agrobacterium tumefaciens]MBP2520580.1 general L-amino acid transport system permease protein [Agrobacterium tumefaciens]MBP2579249.1 general L-amino acid transport system permease protein [Agrobacterium tumefaciens]MBP2597535.1 general L-amino acid transport system permease protein [Agrobacterium tumefaciens]MCW8060298.1 ABC transporter permease subunit [Agrobact
MSTIATPGPRRPGIYRRLLIWWGHRPIAQLAVIASFVALLVYLGINVTTTMARIGVSPGFDFLWRSANFEIGESPITFAAGDPYLRAMLAGLFNTLKVSLIGCIFATILGVAVGVAGLSGNLLLAFLVRWYVELIRNTPLLLQLFFWISLAKAFPAPRQAGALLGSVYLTNRGVYLPAISVEGLPVNGPVFATLIVFALGLMLAVLSNLKRLHGKNVAVATVAILGAAAIAFVTLGAKLTFETPALAGFNIRGGYNLTPEFAALLTGLIVKFSAAIAEIVRAGIQSVNRGQWEAARALGLHNGQIMRLIVLPQALRVITPLATSSYLDLTKDSSLAVAIGYPDLVSIVNTTANTTGQSLEALMILIGTYLGINLVVSALMNQYNKRVALKGVAR